MSAAKSSHGSKNLIIVVFLIIGLAAGIGYFTQSEELRDTDMAAAATNTEGVQPAALELPPADHPVFAARDGDIVTGSPDAPITILEYASLSCPHCAHFQAAVLPGLKKKYLDTGKAKLIFRHFPLNEPAMRGAQLAECLGGDQRKVFITTLFATQKDWAFQEKFVDALKKIAALNGMDSAAFTSCMNDKPVENRILNLRAEAAKVLGVEHTPTLFINGKPYRGELALADVEKALAQ